MTSAKYFKNLPEICQTCLRKKGKMQKHPSICGKCVVLQDWKKQQEDERWYQWNEKMGVSRERVKAYEEFRDKWYAENGITPPSDAEIEVELVKCIEGIEKCLSDGVLAGQHEEVLIGEPVEAMCQVCSIRFTYKYLGGPFRKYCNSSVCKSIYKAESKAKFIQRQHREVGRE